MINLNNVSKTYYTKSHEVEALKNINIKFSNSGLYFILGQSGSGKSTLLNILGGLDTPTSGSIEFFNENVSSYTDKQWDEYRNNHLGFVFQSFNLLNHLTVLDNIMIKLETLNMYSSEERYKLSIDVLKEVGLEDHINKKPTQLSGGQQQRVAIARALVSNPRIILCDEPTGALDSDTSLEIMNLLKSISYKTLIIIVSHDNEIANTYSDYIINLHNGCCDEVNNTLDENVNYNTISTSINLLSCVILSFKNVRSKLRRSVLTSITSALAIFTVLLVFALSTGLSNEINYVNENYLINNPISISNTEGYLTQSDIELTDTISDDLYDIMHYTTGNTSYLYNTNKTLLILTSRVLPRNHHNLSLQYNVEAGSLDLKEDETVLIFDKNNSYDQLNYLFPELYGIYSHNAEDLIGLEIGLASLDDVYLWDDNTELMSRRNENEVYEDLDIYKVGAVLSPKDLYPYNDMFQVSNILGTGLYFQHSVYDDLIEENQNSVFASKFYSNNYNLHTGVEFANDTEIETYELKYNLKINYLSIRVVPSSYETKDELISQISSLYTYELSIYDSVAVSEEFTNDTTALILVIISLIAFISIIVSGILIFILTYASILQRKKEIGILRGLGISKNRTNFIFSFETIIISSVSTLIAIIILLIIKNPINDLVYSNIGFSSIIAISTLKSLFIIILCNLIFFVSTYLPVKKGVNIDIAEIIR